jgi:hypothetical protein
MLVLLTFAAGAALRAAIVQADRLARAGGESRGHDSGGRVWGRPQSPQQTKTGLTVLCRPAGQVRRRGSETGKTRWKVALGTESKK